MDFAVAVNSSFYFIRITVKLLTSLRIIIALDYKLL